MLNCAFLTQITTKRYRPWSNKCYPHKIQKYRYPKSVGILILSQTSLLADLWAGCPILSGVFLSCYRKKQKLVSMFLASFEAIFKNILDIKKKKNTYTVISEITLVNK